MIVYRLSKKRDMAIMKGVTTIKKEDICISSLIIPSTLLGYQSISWDLTSYKSKCLLRSIKNFT